jgi:phosphatidylglycerophosphate synthase
VIKQAYLVRRPSISPDAVVGGLPVVLRQVLTLQDAGIEKIDSVHNPGPALVARAGCVWHPALIKRLARLPTEPSRVLVVGAGDAATYVCDEQHVAAVIAAMEADKDVPLERTNVALRPGEFAVCPRTDAERREATRLLLRSLEKPSDGIVSRHLHRPVSRTVTRWLLPTSITPNAMTLVAALFGLAALPFAFRGGYWSVLIGAALFETQNILDGCDGEIARLKYLRSRGGEWLDQVLDDLLNIAFLTAVGVALSASYGWVWPLTVVCIAAQVVHVIGLYAGLIFRAGGRGSVATLRWRIDRPGAGRRTLGDLTRRDLYSLLYLICAALNIVLAAFLWHAAITIGSAVVTTVQWIAWNGPEFYAGEGATDPAGEAMA